MANSSAVAEPLTDFAPHNDGAYINDSTDDASLAETMLDKFVCRTDRVGQAIEPISVRVTGSGEIFKKLQRHLNGEVRLGLYDLLPDGTAQWAVVEFEDHGDAAVGNDHCFADALKYQNRLEELSIPSIIERSKNLNGRCYHLHIRFDEPLAAKLVLDGLRAVGKEVFGNFPNEVFPKGDSGIGNFVWLPLFGGVEDVIYSKSGEARRGGGIPSERTVFVDKDGLVLEDQVEVLTSWPPADAKHFAETMLLKVQPVPATPRTSLTSTGIELNQPGLDRMEANCPIVKRWVENPIGWRYEHWLGLASNYIGFDGGWERFIELSRQDAANFNQYEIDRIRDEVLKFHGPQTYDKFRDQGLDFEVPLSGPKAPAGWATKGRKPNSVYSQIGWADTLKVKNGDDWIETDLACLKDVHLASNEEIAIMCPACSSQSALARLDEFHFAHIWCDKCQKDYYEAPLSPNMFTYKNKLLRVDKRGGRFISMEVLEEASFRTKKDYEYVQKKLLTDPNRRFLDNNFQVRQMGNAEFDCLDYEFNMEENALVYKFPAIPVKVCDNALIDQFLGNMFGIYSGFIKDWMAMYSYTNYTTLPVIVLTGERACGKNTFADLVGSIFPTLKGEWEGVKESFNDQYKCKLLIVDENPHAEKPMQYTEIKKITGNKVLRINEKYTPAYHVPNNINIIIATNDPRPMFLKAREEPKSENVNNFFIYKCPDVPADKIDRTLGNKLEERTGWYVRSELKARYESLIAEGNTSNRYALPAAITPFARDLFASAGSTVEIEAEELARILVCGIDIPNHRNTYAPNIQFQAYAFNGAQYVQFQNIRDLVGQLGFKGSPNQPKAYVTVLQDQGVLSHESARCADRHLGYRILRSKNYYTTTVSGVLSVAVDGNDESTSAKTDFHHPSKPNRIRILDLPNDRNDENDVPF